MPLLSLLSSRCRSTSLQRGVAQPDLVDVRGGLGLEEVGAERAEREPVDVLARRRPARARRVVALVDQAEEHAERVVEVGAGLRALGRQLDQGQLAQPVEAVALVVLRRTGRQHAQLGGGLGVEQEEDPVEEAQRLLGQRLGLVRRQRVEALRPRGGARPRWR